MRSLSKIESFMNMANCSKEIAIAYLDAEEWVLADALASYLCDNRR